MTTLSKTAQVCLSVQRLLKSYHILTDNNIWKVVNWEISHSLSDDQLIFLFFFKNNKEKETHKLSFKIPNEDLEGSTFSVNEKTRTELAYNCLKFEELLIEEENARGRAKNSRSKYYDKGHKILNESL